MQSRQAGHKQTYCPLTGIWVACYRDILWKILPEIAITNLSQPICKETHNRLALRRQSGGPGAPSRIMTSKTAANALSSRNRFVAKCSPLLSRVICTGFQGGKMSLVICEDTQLANHTFPPFLYQHCFCRLRKHFELRGLKCANVPS